MRRAGIAIVCMAFAMVSHLPATGQVENPVGKTTGPEAVVEYSIDAQLLPVNRRLEGTQVLTWRNSTVHPARTLRFHLYYNAFRGPETTFMKESALGRFRLDDTMKSYRYGGIDVLEVRRIGGPDLTERMAFIAPDDGNRQDRTVMEIPLEDPVPPGGTVRLRFRFRLEIPEIFARTGSWEDYFFLGQWFPKIGVFQKDGTWHCHQFHASAEFFADFGKYRVAITLPQSFVVGATGDPVSVTTGNDGRKTHTYVQDRIHDFAWTAWPKFLELRRQAEVPGRDRPVEVVLLLDPRHEAARDRYFRSVIFAMRFLSEKLFPYPYNRITVVDPPLPAMKSGGMEYPTLITAGHCSLIPEGARFTEMVTIHEFGHQYWYGLIASDEFREAWLDEGVNTFFEGEIMEAYFGAGPSLVDLSWLRLGDSESRRLSLRNLPVVEKVNQPSWHFLSSGNYSSHVYSRAAVFIDTLKGYLGKNKLYDFFALYARRYAYRHPTSRDFIDTLKEVTGQDLEWAFNQFINGTSRLDLAVHSISSEKLKGDPVQYRNRVRLVRREGYFPAEVLICLKNDREVRYLWKDRGRWKDLEFIHESPLRAVVIDPEFLIPLDHDLANNSRVVRKSPREHRRRAVNLGFLFQTLLGMLSM